MPYQWNATLLIIHYIAIFTLKKFFFMLLDEIFYLYNGWMPFSKLLGLWYFAHSSIMFWHIIQKKQRYNIFSNITLHVQKHLESNEFVRIVLPHERQVIFKQLPYSRFDMLINFYICMQINMLTWQWTWNAYKVPIMDNWILQENKC